jgi:hypothetical protein
VQAAGWRCRWARERVWHDVMLLSASRQALRGSRRGSEVLSKRSEVKLVGVGEARDQSSGCVCCHRSSSVNEGIVVIFPYQLALGFVGDHSTRCLVRSPWIIDIGIFENSIGSHTDRSNDRGANEQGLSKFREE